MRCPNSSVRACWLLYNQTISLSWMAAVMFLHSHHVPCSAGHMAKTFPISKLLLTMMYQTMQITWGLSIYDQLLWGTQRSSNSCFHASERSFAQLCLQSPSWAMYLTPHWFWVQDTAPYEQQHQALSGVSSVIIPMGPSNESESHCSRWYTNTDLIA